jgi:hypothetical protein
MASRLRLGGRLVLDVYHRSFFERHQGAREFERNGEPIRETKRMRGSRLHVRLEYGLSGATDRFSWELFTPDELVARARDVGLRALLACSGFDEARAPTPDTPRMQLVLERDRSDG